MTNNDLKRDSAVMMSSTMPSAEVLLLGVTADMFWNGKHRNGRLVGQRQRLAVSNGDGSTVAADLRSRHPRCIDTNRPRDVLDLLLASILERSVNLAFDLAKYLVADQDATGIGQSLQPRRDIHALSIDISVLLNDDITEIEADAKLQRRARQLRLGSPAHTASPLSGLRTPQEIHRPWF